MSLLFPSSNRPDPDRCLPEGRLQLPVIGWRCWRMRPTAEGVMLESLHHVDCWSVDITHARCDRCPPWMVNLHQAPAISCECGLYAFSRPGEAMRHAIQHAATLSACHQAPPVVGAVIGWGRVVQHGSGGWRAEHARPVALLNTGHHLLEAAALRYGVPLVSKRGLCLLPQEYGERLLTA